MTSRASNSYHSTSYSPPSSASLETAAEDVGDVAAALAYADAANSAPPALTIPLGEDRPDLVMVRVPKDVRVDVVDLEEYLERPRRKTGTAVAHNADSFAAYWHKHADDGSELWAHERNLALVGVIDAFEDIEPRWGKHRVQLQLTKTRDWKAWEDHDGKWFTQGEFAEFVERMQHTFVSPDQLTMLELAQSLEGTKGAQFAMGDRLDNGQRRFSYVETIEGRAGRNGDLDIPTTIELAVEPFDAYGTTHTLLASFRWRVTPGGLLLGYVLVAAEDTLREAYRGVVAEVEGQVERAAWRGVPVS